MRTAQALLLLLTACSASGPDAAEANRAPSEQASAQPEFALDGSVVGAPPEELAKAGDHPRPSAQFELTNGELAALGAELAKDYSPEDFDPREIAGMKVAPPSFRAAAIDLNGDGVDEILTLLASFGACGSGGCRFRVYSMEGGGLRKVSGSTITRMPIGVTDTATRNWRNLTVFICGGGLDPCGRSMLKFDGSRYPSNPTMPPAVRTSEVGTVVLTDESPIHFVPRPPRES